jgi:predicted RNA-binding protein associated with RNAse of E/G family
LGNPRISEIKTTLSGRRQVFDCERIHYAVGETIVSYRMPADHLLADLLLPAGSLSLGYFWEDRPYNCYHWVDDKGQTLALYFNVCDSTQISPEQVAWRDLIVDILITPDQRCRVLDEDELPNDLDHNLLAYINATRDLLCAGPASLLQEFETSSQARLSGT